MKQRAKIRIHSDQLLNALKLVFKGFPKDVEVIGGQYSSERDAFTVVLCSKEFKSIEQGYDCEDISGDFEPRENIDKIYKFVDMDGEISGMAKDVFNLKTQTIVVGNSPIKSVTK